MKILLDFGKEYDRKCWEYFREYIDNVFIKMVRDDKQKTFEMAQEAEKRRDYEA